MMLTELVRQNAISPTMVDLQSPTSAHPKCHPSGQGQPQQYHHHHQPHQQQQQTMMIGAGGVLCGSIVPSGMDSNTFLPQTSVLDSHIRQNSTDSGLGWSMIYYIIIINNYCYHMFITL